MQAQPRCHVAYRLTPIFLCLTPVLRDDEVFNIFITDDNASDLQARLKGMSVTL